MGTKQKSSMAYYGMGNVTSEGGTSSISVTESCLITIAMYL